MIGVIGRSKRTFTRAQWEKREHFNNPLDFAISTYCKTPLLHFRRARRRIRKSCLIGDISF
jgi:hypothetical protein